MNNETDDLAPVQINLNSDDLSESVLGQFGAVVKMLLKGMFGDEPLIPGTVRGTPAQIRSFQDALSANRDYIQSYMSNGVSNPRTQHDKQALLSAVNSFERHTGRPWPFK